MDGGRIRAVLGPTNTGKTWYAIDRMLGHRTGMLGLPLRLLAREVYDKVRLARGPSVVALITGEERIIPERARYWVCTVEAMPIASGVDFLGVDEIQLCGDYERGHIFTERLLKARGQVETLFLGSETMRPAITRLVDGVQFEHRTRYSNLSYTGTRKISRMRPRSAIVAFSVEDVYSIAELVRRQRGGAAVVMGALSPRTRNAQVELYQNGEVDFLVATDAIGMGLNLNIDHVAFAGLTKFDGSKIRMLAPNEIAQIAGRAGRYQKPGSFGTTADVGPIDPQTVLAIEENRFRNLHALQWRNSELDFRSAGTLIVSLQQMNDNPLLERARDAEDYTVLRAMSEDAAILSRLLSPVDVRLLWGVCQIPNFRSASAADHAELVKTVFTFVRDNGFIPDDWLEQQVRRIDRIEGDVDTLSRRIAAIRTWTYVSQRPDWVENSGYWRERTREIEDRISDALHLGLTKRFVDRRTSVLLKQLKQKERLVATVNEHGELAVEGEHVGRIEGFRFVQAASSTPEEARTVRAASLNVLAPEYALRASRLYNAPNAEFDLTEQGGLMWGEHAVGKLVPGKSGLEPEVEVFVDEEAGEDITGKVERRLRAFVSQKIATHCEALQNLAYDEEITGLARGVAYRLVESFGVLRRSEVASEVKDLDQETRRRLRKHGVRFGQQTIHVGPILKPEATRWRIVLWSQARGLAEFPPSPPPGLVTIPADPAMPDGYYPLSGYSSVGNLAIRIDMLERLLNMLREQPGRTGFEATADMLSITGLSLEGFSGLMRGLGYQATRFERPKAKVAPPDSDVGAPGVGGMSGEDPVDQSALPAPSTEVGRAAVPDDRSTVAVTDDGAGEAPPVPSTEVGRAAAPDDRTTDTETDDGAGEAPAVPSAGDADSDAAASEAPGSRKGATKEPEIAVCYAFVWPARRRRSPERTRESAPPEKRQGGGRQKPQEGRRRPKAKGPSGKSRPADFVQPAARKPEKPIDPDNPFSVLKALKDRL